MWYKINVVITTSFFDLALFTILIISVGQVGAEKKLAELLFKSNE